MFAYTAWVTNRALEVDPTKRASFGSMGKAFHPGRSAAALLAREGFTSGERGIEGPRGFAHVLADARDLSKITEDQSHIEVELKDGRRLTKFVEQSLGNIHRALSDTQLEEKFRDQAEMVLPAADVDALIALYWRIDTLEDVGELVNLAVPVQARVPRVRRLAAPTSTAASVS